MTCEYCDAQFTVRTSYVERGQGRFCSRSCSSKRIQQLRAAAVTPNVECAYCGEPFYKNPSKMANSKSGLFFCCREHKDLAQRHGGIAEIQPPHYADGKCAYRAKAFRLLKNECLDCGFDKCTNILVVHHLDMDRTNNDISNLVLLCPTCHDIRHYLTVSGRWAKKPSEALAR